MKTKLFLALSCLLLFSILGQAQLLLPPYDSQNPMAQERMKKDIERVIRSSWEDRTGGLVMGLVVSDRTIRAALDITDEQFQRMRNPIGPEIRNNPEFVKLDEEGAALRRALHEAGDPTGQNADEEIQRKFLDNQEKMTSLVNNIANDVIDNLLTPEQKQTIRELQLALMSEMPFVLPGAFEALHLSDAQKQQMKDIKKELEPEFEKHLAKFVEGQIVLNNKMTVEIDKQGGFANIRGPNTMLESMQAATKKLIVEDPEFKKIHEETTGISQVFSAQFRTKMFDVLTDEQFARLQELNDNPPDYVLAIRKKIRAMRGESEQTGGGGWVPGPGSWQPGQGIPEGYRQERNTRNRFPSVRKPTDR